MASFTYNEGSFKLADRTIDYVNAGTVIKVMLIGLLTPYTPDPDHATVNLISGSELNVPSGYQTGFAGTGRKTLANKTITKDNATNRVIYDADDPSAWTLGAGDSVV